jgi:hypothetical protein
MLPLGGQVFAGDLYYVNTLNDRVPPGTEQTVRDFTKRICVCLPDFCALKENVIRRIWNIELPADIFTRDGGKDALHTDPG